jgi:hypothetical protein
MPYASGGTSGMKGPEVLDKEKNAYHKALEAQLKKETDAAQKEGEVHKAMLQQQAKSQIATFTLQVEEQLKLQCIKIDQNTNLRTAALMEAAVNQRTLVDERSAIATMEFEKRRAMEQCAQKSAALQKQYHDAEMKMMREFQQVSEKGARVGVAGVM